jgi:GTP cyclohydrolase II
LRGEPPGERPFITLSYAQSLDGSIAARDGRPLALSSPPSLFRSHALRARHDGLLVGVGTIVTDDPQLTVRHAPGPNPQPVVLDTHLRTPAPARVLKHPRPPWLVAEAQVSPARKAPLLAAGARVLDADRREDGLLSLPSVLAALRQQGLRSVMVEGGSTVIRSFLEARLVDWVVLTVAPVFVGGRAVLSPGNGVLPGLRLLGWEASGPDLIVWGELA